VYCGLGTDKTVLQDEFILLHNLLVQERGRPAKVHLQDTVEEMHRFNAIRKLKVTTSLYLLIDLGSMVCHMPCYAQVLFILCVIFPCCIYVVLL